MNYFTDFRLVLDDSILNVMEMLEMKYPVLKIKKIQNNAILCLETKNNNIFISQNFLYDFNEEDMNIFEIYINNESGLEYYYDSIIKVKVKGLNEIENYIDYILNTE